jgi:hypothetical protein
VNDFGQYYHANAIVRTPAGTYHCAIDVDSMGLPNGVEWRVVELGESDLHGVAALPHGWHFLPSEAESGALDYVRSPELRPEPGYFFELSDTVLESLRRLPQAAIYPPWKQGTSRDALADLEPLLEDPKALYVFGEPFTNGLGVTTSTKTRAIRPTANGGRRTASGKTVQR